MTLVDWCKSPKPLDEPDIRSYMPELVGALTPEGFKFMPDSGNGARLSGVTWELEVAANLVPPSAPLDAKPPHAGRIERVIRVPIDGSPPSVEHVLFELPASYRDLGLGPRVVKASVDEYAKADIPEIQLEAAHYGRYVWAMCGFDFADERSRDAVVASANKLALEFATAGLCREIDLGGVEFPWQIAQIADPVSMAGLEGFYRSRVKPAVRMADNQEQVPLGKALLLGETPPWRGIMDIRPGSIALALLARYAERDAED